MKEKPRILIFVVAYEAQATLEKVLNRIPKKMFFIMTRKFWLSTILLKDKTFGGRRQNTLKGKNKLSYYHLA